MTQGFPRKERAAGVETPQRCFLCNRLGYQGADCRVWADQVQGCQICHRKGHTADVCRAYQEKTACAVCSKDKKEGMKADLYDWKRTSIEVKQEQKTDEARLHLPVVDGEIKGRLVSVLRDSGTNTVLVRRSLVDDACIQILDITPADLAKKQKDESIRKCFEKVSTPFKRKRSCTSFEFEMHGGNRHHLDGVYSRLEENACNW